MVYSGSAQGVVSLKALVELCQQAVRQQRPPDIAVLYAKVADCGGYLEFLRIVREFVPEFEQEILGVAKQGGQMAKFASRFEDKYFPLWPMMADGEMETYEELVYQTPVNVMGLSSDEMGEPEQFRNGIQMMLLLIITDGDGEARVPLVNSALSFLPESLVTMASPLSQGDLHRLLDHTDYQGVADESDIWEHSTGSFFLDADDESSGYEMIDWSHENIEALTEDWHRAEEITDRVIKLAEWLEVNPLEHFRKLLKFIHHEGKEVEDEGTQLPLGLAAEP